MSDARSPFGQDKATQLADANKMIRLGVIALVVSIGLTIVSSQIGSVVVVSPLLLILSLGSIGVGLVKRSKAS